MCLEGSKLVTSEVSGHYLKSVSFENIQIWGGNKYKEVRSAPTSSCFALWVGSKSFCFSFSMGADRKVAV